MPRDATVCPRAARPSLASAPPRQPGNPQTSQRRAEKGHAAARPRAGRPRRKLRASRQTPSRDAACVASWRGHSGGGQPQGDQGAPPTPQGVPVACACPAVPLASPKPLTSVGDEVTAEAILQLPASHAVREAVQAAATPARTDKAAGPLLEPSGASGRRLRAATVPAAQQRQRGLSNAHRRCMDSRPGSPRQLSQPRPARSRAPCMALPRLARLRPSRSGRAGCGKASRRQACSRAGASAARPASTPRPGHQPRGVRLVHKARNDHRMRARAELRALLLALQGRARPRRFWRPTLRSLEAHVPSPVGK